MSLSVEQFASFHRAVHGHDPFEWQERLLRKIEADRCWPRVLDLPTGSGKTTCVDIALFALAMDAQRPNAERWCPRRIAMVVDRRVVVDQVAERGRKLLTTLMTSNDASVASVRDALQALTAGEEEPLAVYTLRGGIPKDDGWARTPHQPLVLASTVDQLGSRLLLQGYGVSVGMRPIHCGLLANDTLVLLDEVHLSRPFAETLDAISSLRGRRRTNAPTLVARFHHVFLSATPGVVDEHVFRLHASERKKSSPLGPRLHARKPAKLVHVASRDELAGKCAMLAREMLGRHDVVAVVVNRVASAQHTAADLRNQLNDEASVVLLTGRMRPLDRDDVLARWRHRIAAGRERSMTQGKLIVVGTQCIEAGADFDFDAIITESASLDALRQRFGRLDRLGVYGKSEAVVVHVNDKDSKEDPVYGAALAKTWRWLGQQGGKHRSVDFGVEVLRVPDELDDLVAPKKNAPVLLPAYLDLWMQTSPEPAVVPEAALFLHGPESGPADVQIVWRADLDETTLSRDDEAACEIVASLRPSSLEAVSVPFVAARSWLRGDGVTNIMDVDSVVVNDERAEGRESDRSWRALRWRGAHSEIIGWRELRPGDTMVVPCVRGGLRVGSFDPTGAEPVADLAERAVLLSRGRATLRLHPAVLANLGFAAIDQVSELPEIVRDALDALEADSEAWRRVWLSGLTGRLRRTVVDVEGLDPWVVVEGDRLSAGELRHALSGATDVTFEYGADTTTDDEDSFHVGRSGITLADHSCHVEAQARKYASAVGLPEPLVSDISLAGWLHDIGKADRRFQILLRGGDEVEFYKDERSWAKSAMRPGDRHAQTIARERSGYPLGARHEVLSVAMIEGVRSVVAAKAHDLDLVLHLVGSHHGYCRPFAPGVADPVPEEVALAEHTSVRFGRIDFASMSSDHQLHRLDSPLADRFWTLVERYGWFELCWLETILRLADHRASEAEAQRQR